MVDNGGTKFAWKGCITEGLGSSRAEISFSSTVNQISPYPF